MWKRPVDLALPANLEAARGDMVYASSPLNLRPGHRIMLLRDGDEVYPAMLAAIRAARSYVDLEVFILHDDAIGRTFAEALAERARAGVTCRLMYDGAGSYGLPFEYVEGLRAAGVQVVEWGPLVPWKMRFRLNKRDHRKILVVDGRVGFTGGLNIGHEYQSKALGGDGWHDFHVRVEGPAVAEMAQLFRRNWMLSGGERFVQVQEHGEESVATDDTSFAVVLNNEEARRRRSIRVATMHALRRAKHSIHIMSAYFIPDRGVRRHLANAVNRGVDVRIVVPGHGDLKSVLWAGQHTYTPLLKAGVHVHEWPETMLHAKIIVVDGVWAAVGSYNLDARSLFHNLEIVLNVVDRSFGEKVEAEFAADVAVSHDILLPEWKRRPAWRKAMEWLFYQFRFWL